MVFRSFLAGLVCAGAVLAEGSFPSPSYFRETFSKPDTRVVLRPPVRLQDFVVNDQLELSLRSYLELVMANNTEIAIQRLTVETAKNAIQRAMGVWDPMFIGSFTNRRSRTPSNDVLAGAATLSQLNQPANFSYQQTLPSGTRYDVGFTASKTASNSGFQNFNPALNSGLAFGFVQPLLRDRGPYVNRLPLMIARSRLRTSEYNLRDQLTRLVADSETVYWNLLQARETLRVREAALGLAKAALERTQRELELGAVSPLDIYQPQQAYATAEIEVSQARYNIRQQEDALRRQIGADLDPDVRRFAIVLTETPLPPNDTTIIDAEEKVEIALRTRPDIRAALQSLDVDDLNIKLTKNALKPELSLVGNYTSQGRGGVFYQRENVFNDALGGRSTVVTTIPGGFGDALDQMFGFGFPVYSFGLQLRLPIRNRRASADLADAMIQKRRDTLQLRNVEQQVRLETLQAVSQVEASKASVKLAAIAQDFAQKRLDAEQKKYELGTSQIFFVLQAQQDLVNAQSTLVRESVNYRRNLLNLLRRTGELLDDRGVVVE
jgi:outer membrane protein TolC